MKNKLEKIFAINVTAKVLVFILKFQYIECENRTTNGIYAKWTMAMNNQFASEDTVMKLQKYIKIHRYSIKYS